MYNVLLVDDEENILQGLRIIVPWEKYGFQIAATAHDGKMALDIIEQGGIDLVITDIWMRPVDGLALARELYTRNARIPVVVLSAYRDFEYVRACMEYGVSHYLLKPINEDKLIEILQKVCRELDTRSRQHKKAYSDTLYRMICGEISLDNVGIYTLLQNIGIPTAIKSCGILLLEAHKNTAAPAAAVESFLRQKSLGTVVHQEANILLCFLYSQNRSQPDPEPTRRMIEGSPDLSAGYWGKMVASPDQLRYSYVSIKNMKIVLSGLSDRPLICFPDFEQYIMQWKCVDMQTAWMPYRLFHALSSGTWTDVQAEIDQCIKWLLQKCLGVTELRSTLINILEQLAYDAEHLSDLLDRACRAEDLNAVTRLLEDACNDNYCHTQQEKQDMSAEIVRKVNQLIADEYGNCALSIKNIASKLGYNPSYLGRIYTAKAGIGIKEEISRYRIEKAKYLLRTTSDKVSDIANSVGITDSNLFYSLFRKYTNMTPSEYRKSL